MISVLLVRSVMLAQQNLSAVKVHLCGQYEYRDITHVRLSPPAPNFSILERSKVICVRTLGGRAWRFGKVDDVVTGHDGHVRGAKVKVAKKGRGSVMLYRSAIQRPRRAAAREA